MVVLREYQRDLIDRTRALVRTGMRRVCIQGATGMGKTVLAAQLLAHAAARGKRSWFVCHRTEILDQTVHTFVDAADLHVGIVASEYPSDVLAPVQVCSVPSLVRRMSRLSRPDLIVFDEVHHIAAHTWAAIAQAHPEACQLGITATPCRTDGRGLRPFFDALLCGPSTADLIAQGYLSPYRLYAPARIETSQMHTVAGDYNRAEVHTAMTASTVVGDAIGTYQQHCPDARALVFAWSVASSRDLAGAFRAAGIPAAHVDGDTPADDRRAAMEQFRTGALRVLCNCDLFGEGLDVPSVDAVFLLRPTKSVGLYLQQCGRGLRPAPAKPVVRLFDHTGNYERHGLPDEARVWSLDGITRTPTIDRLQPVKRCPSCFGVASAARTTCPYCQAAYPVKARQIMQVAGDLVELRAQMPALARACTSLADFHALATRLGYKPGWAWMAWQRARRHRHPRIIQDAPKGLHVSCP
jgi:superfamily II DNA or RNA helicase